MSAPGPAGLTGPRRADPTARTPLARYGIALACAAVAFLLTTLLRAYLQETIYLFYFPAVVVSTLIAGFGPGVLTGLVGVATAIYYFLEPVGTFKVASPSELAGLAIFVGLSGVIDTLRERFLVARREAERREAEARELARELELKAAQIARVIGELERRTEEAEHANRAKSDFLAVMSHELRTPLNAIAGFVDLIDMAAYGPVTAEQRDALRRIQLSQGHLLAIIDDLLNFVRLDAGQVQFQPEPASVADLLVGVVPMVEGAMHAKQLRYVAPSGPAPAVFADPEKAQIILRNLLTNAIKFTDAGGELRVEWEERGESVRIRVSDNGRGIEGTQLERIFEPFVQVDGGLTRETGGVGLGLAISRDLARGMGGDLAAESTPGKGSTFTLTLPAARAQLRYA